MTFVPFVQLEGINGISMEGMVAVKDPREYH